MNQLCLCLSLQHSVVNLRCFLHIERSTLLLKKYLKQVAMFTCYAQHGRIFSFL